MKTNDSLKPAEPLGIQITKDYSKFKYVHGNRNVNNRHLVDLTLSIANKNMLAQAPILVNEKMEVIDGQHRLEVAKNNDLDIYYIVVPGATIDEVIQLNTHTKDWTIYDYVDSFATRGKQGYVWLIQFMQDYNLRFSQAMLFVYGSDIKWITRKVKAGDFEPTSEMKEKAIARADVFYDLRPFIKRTGTVPKAIMLAIIEIEDEGYGKLLVKNVVKQGKPFVPALYRKEALQQLRTFAEATTN